MKHLILLLLTSVSVQSFATESNYAKPARSIASTGYTLSEICNHYTDSPNTCSDIPFCQLKARPAGCHQRPDIGFGEELCVTFDKDQCNPAITACQWYGDVETYACVANRSKL
ncbi:MAG: hypothetical protein ACXVCY_02325 [Pseudobdellovibrionaceae bacterium]